MTPTTWYVHIYAQAVGQAPESLPLHMTTRQAHRLTNNCLAQQIPHAQANEAASNITIRNLEDVPSQYTVSEALDHIGMLWHGSL